MAVRAPALQRIGAWASLGDSLADDNQLGRNIARAGGTLGIAHTVLALEAPALDAKTWARHQHRAFATFRLCNPRGSLGLPLTQGVGFTFLFALLRPLSPARWLLHLALLALRTNTANSLPGPRFRLGEIWLASLAEPLFWLLSRLPIPIRWGAKRWPTNQSESR